METTAVQACIRVKEILRGTNTHTQRKKLLRNKVGGTDKKLTYDQTVINHILEAARVHVSYFL